jgi:hypothetical protein
LIAFSGSPLVAKKGNTMNKKMVVINKYTLVKDTSRLDII